MSDAGSSRGREAPPQRQGAPGPAHFEAPTKSAQASQTGTAPAARTSIDLGAAADAHRGSKAQGSPGMEMAPAVATAGKAGERNIRVEKFWVLVDGHYPCGFDVATLPGHSLEVEMIQLAYSKTYAGTGAVKTGVTPVAPIGTPGKMVARDLTTGETVEQPWVWHLVGGSGDGFFSALWKALKNAVWKSG